MQCCYSSEVKGAVLQRKERTESFELEGAFILLQPSNKERRYLHLHQGAEPAAGRGDPGISTKRRGAKSRTARGSTRPALSEGAWPGGGRGL